MIPITPQMFAVILRVVAALALVACLWWLWHSIYKEPRIALAEAQTQVANLSTDLATANATGDQWKLTAQDCSAAVAKMRKDGEAAQAAAEAQAAEARKRKRQLLASTGSGPTALNTFFEAAYH